MMSGYSAVAMMMKPMLPLRASSRYTSSASSTRAFPACWPTSPGRIGSPLLFGFLPRELLARLLVAPDDHRVALHVGLDAALVGMDAHRLAADHAFFDAAVEAAFLARQALELARLATGGHRRHDARPARHAVGAASAIFALRRGRRRGLGMRLVHGVLLTLHWR